jgi:hypothetical protein
MAGLYNITLRRVANDQAIDLVRLIGKAVETVHLLS